MDYAKYRRTVEEELEALRRDRRDFADDKRQYRFKEGEGEWHDMKPLMVGNCDRNIAIYERVLRVLDDFEGVVTGAAP